MRYVFVGKKTKYVGKTLWEIVGNLKNFGVGRLVRHDPHNDSHLSFFKIVKVQPLPPDMKMQFENRRVWVWIEEIYKDRKLPIRPILTSTEIAKFRLIPKMEEEEYLKRAAELECPEKVIFKYCAAPPLYKKLWEEENSKNESLPKLKTEIVDCVGYKVILKDETYPPSTCSLYKTNQTVEEMYHELVRLKKIVKSNEKKE